MATIILKNLYHNGEQVKEIIQNGDIIYVGAQKLVFDVDKDSISFEDTGGSTTITITANEKWTMTKPEWITASQTSGFSTATITLSASATETERTGNIVIACGGKTKTISVEQLTYKYFRITNRTSNEGTITFRGQNEDNNLSIASKTNNGIWSDYYEYASVATFTLPANGYVEFRGNKDHFSITFKSISISVDVDYDASGELTSLISASTISEQCFLNLFGGNTHLINTSGLTITGTGISAYQGLFLNCTNLVSAPKLIAELPLAAGTYNSMFRGCTSLTTAPEMDFASIDINVCAYMFLNCSSLNYIKCLANGQMQTGWLSGVASTGTFVKKAGVTWPTGNSGIPSGWTVIEE